MSDDFPAQACVFFCCCLLSHALARAPTPSTRRAQRDAATYFERLELVLRLAHVGLEEGERAELLDPVARVPVDGVVPFMDLDATEHALLFGQGR